MLKARCIFAERRRSGADQKPNIFPTIPTQPAPCQSCRGAPSCSCSQFPLYKKLLEKFLRVLKIEMAKKPQLNFEHECFSFYQHMALIRYLYGSQITSSTKHSFPLSPTNAPPHCFFRNWPL